MHRVFVLSDGSGKTAEQFVRAALTQFPSAEAEVEVRGNVRTRPQAAEIVQEAAASGGFVVYTVVSKVLRRKILELGRLRNVETIDLMGPLLARLTQQLSDSPAERPGAFRELNKAYFQRIEAMEFALRHDDGQHLEELKRAELVIVGVSRTFKTPLSMYLAFRGWLVGNVPLVLGIEVPEVLSEIPPERVYALTTNAARLSALRRVRKRYLGGVGGSYADLGHVREELNYARRICRQHPRWHLINVTHRPIEEIASEILSLVAESQGSPR